MKYRIASLVVLSLLALLASCKAPTASVPAPPPATLTIILPESARAFDTAVFRVHYSDSIKSSWKFQWQFGDSSRDTTADSSISHVYDSAGTYSVRVTLVDSTGETIAKQTAQLPVMPLNAPTLTLTVPDTVYWGDSCVMSVASSQPLRSAWKYTWTLGDSASVSSRQSSILHWYLTPGNYTVRVELDDTVNHILLGSQIDSVHVVARHFDLALLNEMRFATVLCAGRLISTESGMDPQPLSPEMAFIYKPLTWNDFQFEMDTQYSWYDSSSGSSGSFEWSCGGGVDSNTTMISSVLGGNSGSDVSISPNNGSNRSSSGSAGCDFYQVPFRSQSDSDVVFEARGPLVRNAYFSSQEQWTERFYGQSSTTLSIDWSDPSAQVTIIFSKH